MSVYTWLSWFIIALAAGCLAFVVGRAIRLRLLAALILAVLAAGASFSGLTLLRSFAQPSLASVVITSPSNNAQIRGHRLSVTGTVRPADAQVTLVIRSESAVQWSVQSVVRPQQVKEQVGLWSIDAFIGTPEEGRNENFQIIALASADNVCFNLLTGRYLTSGNNFEMIPLWSQSAPVVVRRIE